MIVLIMTPYTGSRVNDKPTLDVNVILFSSQILHHRQTPSFDTIEL